MKQQRTLIVMLVAVATAGVAAFGVYQAIQRMPVRQVEMETVPVVVAKHAIAVGTRLTTDDLLVAAYPARTPVPGAVADPATLVDRGVIVPIGEHEPVTLTRVAGPESGAGLSPIIPAGMRAISVRVNEVVGVAGFVVPGTRVDVLVTFGSATGGSDGVARVVVSNAQVLTAGTRFDQEKARTDNKPIPTSVVTLLVSPEDAQRVALAAAEGRITLTLRNPLDNAPTESAGIRAGGLMGNPTPPPVAPAPKPKPAPVAVAPVVPPPPPPPAPYTVEAIRGAKRTTEPVKNETEEKPRDVPPSEEKPQ